MKTVTIAGHMKRIPENERMDQANAADAYAEADFTEVNRDFVAAVTAALRGRPTSRILDLGCGPGDIPLALAEARVGERVVAVDAATAMLKWAKRRADASEAAHRLALIRADAKALPFPDRSFDAAISNSILHHVANPHNFWSEVARTVSPGGQVFMRDLRRPRTIEDADAIVDTYAQNESEMLRGEFFRSLCAAYTVEEVRHQLDKAGLSELDVRVATDRHLDVFGEIGNRSYSLPE